MQDFAAANIVKGAGSPSQGAGTPSQRARSVNQAGSKSSSHRDDLVNSGKAPRNFPATADNGQTHRPTPPYYIITHENAYVQQLYYRTQIY